MPEQLPQSIEEARLVLVSPGATQEQRQAALSLLKEEEQAQGVAQKADIGRQTREAQEAYAQKFYSDIYEQDVRDRMQAQFARELGMAQQLEAGMRTGETSTALAQQRLAMGQAGAQQAAAMASGNPLASRAAMFAGAQQAGQLAGAGGMARADEMGQAAAGLMQAYARQPGYMQQLEAAELQRRAMLQKAAQAAVSADTALKTQQERQAGQTTAAGIGAGAGLLAGIAPMFKK